MNIGTNGCIRVFIILVHKIAPCWDVHIKIHQITSVFLSFYSQLLVDDSVTDLVAMAHLVIYFSLLVLSCSLLEFTRGQESEEITYLIQ